MLTGDGMSVSLRIDTREFQQAMAQYVQASKKDGAEAVNHQMMNFAVQCVGVVNSSSEFQPKRARIFALDQEDWWPKLVAKVIGHQEGAGAASKAYQAQWSAGQKKLRDAAGRKGAWKLDKEEQSYARLARKVSKEIIKGRGHAMTFLRFWFVKMAETMKPYAKKRPPTSPKRFPGFRTRAKPALPSGGQAIVANAAIEFAYKKRGQKTASGEERLLQKVVDKGLPATVADMKVYTQRKMQQQAAKFSGKAAA